MEEETWKEKGFKWDKKQKETGVDIVSGWIGNQDQAEFQKIEKMSKGFTKQIMKGNNKNATNRGESGRGKWVWSKR